MLFYLTSDEAFFGSYQSDLHALYDEVVDEESGKLKKQKRGAEVEI